MKRMRPDRQQDLFNSEEPPPSLPPQWREKALQLLQALLIDTTEASPAREDGDEQDHV